MASSINASTTAGVVTTADTSGVLNIQTAGTTAISIDASQAVTMAGRTSNPTTISVGAATPSTSGAGITFPTTQSASTNAKTLDDYEEGTFSPVVKGYTTAGTATYSRQQGHYTKIGNRVFISIDVIWTSGTGAGDLYVDGLVFPTSSSVMVKNYAVLTEGITLTVGNYLAGAGSGISTTQIYIYQSTVGTTTALAVPYDAAGGITISGNYFV